MKIKRWICFILGLVTAILYLPLLHDDFIQYDDQQYVTENPQVQAGLTIHGLAWAFGNHASNWHPLTWLSHMLDCQLYSLNPAGHHLTSLLLHLCNTLLLFLILDRMTGATWRSAFVAALFAWHPLHVESVAWIAERKDVLSTFFWMLTIGAYAKYVEASKTQNDNPKPTWSKGIWYGSALVLFAFGLMSKPMVVTLPLVLLLLDFWPLQRLQTASRKPGMRRWVGLAWEKAPFFALSVGASLLTISAQGQAASIVSTSGLPVSQRVAHAIISYAHYLQAAILPRHLAVYYPYETATAALPILVASVLLLAITAIAVIFIKRLPYLAVGWFWYLGTLVPVIGLVQVGDQAWADRYTYIPLIGIFMAITWAVADLLRRKPLCLLTAAGIGVALIAATSVQLSYWKNTRALFGHASEVIPNNYMAITMLGSLLAQDGKLAEAEANYRSALRIKPDYPVAHFYMGNALDEQGKFNEALAEYQKALWFRPIAEQTHIFMGMVLGKEKKYDEAKANYEAALELNPDSAAAHNNLARILHSQGQFGDAIQQYRAALEINPHLSLARNNLGILLIQKGDLTNGIAELREALRLKPDDAKTEFNLALALNQSRQWDEAAELFRKSEPQNPLDAKGHCQLAIALAHAEQSKQALSEFAKALLLDPDLPDALDGLAWILSTDPSKQLRNGVQAVSMAERACLLTHQADAEKLKTLAAAYAECGRFEDAASTAQQGLAAAKSGHHEALAEKLQQMWNAFKASRPWREQ